jgi:uncharacterized protein (TIGR00725 family)
MTQRRPIIAVVGGNKANDSQLDAAFRVGAAIAEAGAVLLTGGQPTDKPDIKRRAMLGALDASKKKDVAARFVGILPAKEQPKSTGAVEQCLVRTRLESSERNPITGMTCDAMIVFEGGAGTLAELGFALAAEKPILFVGSIESLRRNAKIESKGLLRNLEEGSERFPKILGRRVESTQIDGFIEKCLGECRNSAAVSDDDSWAELLVQKAIKMIDPKALRQDSGFPEGVSDLTKEKFEKLWRMQ